MRRRWTACRLALVLGFAVAVAGVVLAATHRSPSALQTNGTRVSATVTAVTMATGGSTGNTGVVTVRFVADDGTHTADIDRGRDAAIYAVGESVTVVFDPSAPAHAEMLGQPTNAAPIPWPVPLLLGLAVVAIALGGARRLRQTARLLHDNPWVLASSTLVVLPVGGARRTMLTMLELDGAPDESTSLVAPVSWRARSMVDMEPHAWVAGAGRRFLVAGPGGAPMLRAKRIRLTERAFRFGDPTPLPSRLDQRAP